MRPVALGIAAAFLTFAGLTALSGCSTGRIVDNAADRVDESVERAKRQIDDSVDRANTRIDATIEKARTDATALVEKVRESYDVELKATGAEVDRLREEFKKDLDALDRQMEDRLEQIRASASALIAQGDKAAQDRIDQVFRELRDFSTETLKQVKEMMEPINKMATSIAGTSDAATKAIEKIVLRVEMLIDKVNGLLMQITEFVMKLQGKNPDGSKGSTDWAVVVSTIVGIISGAMALLSKKNSDQAKEQSTKIEEARKTERSQQGERWKPEEIDQKIEERLAVRLSQMGVQLPPQDAPLRVPIPPPAPTAKPVVPSPAVEPAPTGDPSPPPSGPV
jgi:hypothetical protein